MMVILLKFFFLELRVLVRKLGSLLATQLRKSTCGYLRLLASQVAHQAGAYLGFCSLKRLGAFLLAPGCDAGSVSGLALA